MQVLKSLKAEKKEEEEGMLKIENPNNEDEKKVEVLQVQYFEMLISLENEMWTFFVSSCRKTKKILWKILQKKIYPDYKTNYVNLKRSLTCVP